MAASLRQRLANQRNAQSSTGPKSDQGKRISRRNAIKHGLTGAGVVLPEETLEAAQVRMDEWNSQLRPFNGAHLWFFERACVESIRLERCEALERTLIAAGKLRAAEHWDADRKAAVAELAAALAARPEVLAPRLETSAHGCDWSIDRWMGLLGHLAEHGDLDAEHRHRALDLLGVPASERGSDPHGLLSAGPEELADRIEAELERLRGLKSTVLEEIDDIERAAAEIGLFADPPQALRLVHRYAAACQRRLAWYLDQLKKFGIVAPAAPDRRRASPPPPQPIPPSPPSRPSAARPPITPDEESRYRERLLASIARRAAEAPAAPAPPSADTPAPAPVPSPTPSPSPATPLPPGPSRPLPSLVRGLSPGLIAEIYGSSSPPPDRLERRSRRRRRA